MECVLHGEITCLSRSINRDQGNDTQGVTNPKSHNTVTNSRPPACDLPRFPNSSRVAHQTDNSVVTFWNNARNQSRVGLQPHHGPVRILPARNRVNHRISIYLSTRAGNLPRDRTSAQVGLDTNRSRTGPFCSDNRAGIIARPRRIRFYLTVI